METEFTAEKSRFGLRRSLIIIGIVALLTTLIGATIWYVTYRKQVAAQELLTKTMQEQQKRLDASKKIPDPSVVTVPTQTSVTATPQLPPAQPTPATPTAPRSVTPATRPAGVTNGGRPQIVGNSDCATKTNAALDLVQSKAPDSYSIITNYTGVIQCADSGSGMYAWESPPRYLVGAATINAGTMWYAGTIVHDSGHSKLYHDYLTNNPGAGSVPSDVYSGAAAEQKCLDLQYAALKQMGADQATLDYVKSVISTDYWDNPTRWW